MLRKKKYIELKISFSKQVVYTLHKMLKTLRGAADVSPPPRLSTMETSKPNQFL